MKKGVLNFKQISESTDHFNLKGMVSPNFVNNGETTAQVFYQPIPPGGQFAFNFPTMILDETIPVRFIDQPGKKNLVSVYFGAYKNCN